MNKTLNKCKQRKNDIIYTPQDLALDMIKNIDIVETDILLDPFFGNGIFYNNYPVKNKKIWCEIEKEKDFFDFNEKVDWIISNPPYSILSKVLEHTTKICNKGFCYIILSTALSVSRIKKIENNNFYLTKISVVQVKKWFGFNCLIVVFEKNRKSILNIKTKLY